jgi:hypothetical protein
MKLDDPRTVRFGKNITLGADMSKLIFLELWTLSEVLNSKAWISLTISDLTKDLRAQILPSVFFCTSLTSPKAPLPIILIVV